MATNKKFKECKAALQMIFLCNPFSMGVFTLVAPSKAAAFAHKKEFTPLMAENYGILSYWLPWRWKKHWMAYEKLSEYSVVDQCLFFLEMAPTEETLQKISDQARAVLWMVAAKRTKFDENYSWNDDADAVHTKYEKCFKTTDIISIFVQAIPKLKDEQVEYLLAEKKLDLFKQYVSKGAIRYEQVKMLVHAAVYAHPTVPLCAPQVGQSTCTEAEVRAVKRSRQLDCQEFLAILIDYVKKHGVKIEIYAYIDSLSAGERGDVVKQALSSALKVHEQCVFTSSHHDDEYTGEWSTFCQNTAEICVEAQMRMNPNQYDVYHSTKHALQAEAIAHFIRKGNIDMCRKIFVNEPENGFVNEEIAHLIHANREVQTLFYQILNELQKKK